MLRCFRTFCRTWITCSKIFVFARSSCRSLVTTGQVIQQLPVPSVTVNAVQKNSWLAVTLVLLSPGSVELRHKIQPILWSGSVIAAQRYTICRAAFLRLHQTRPLLNRRWALPASGSAGSATYVATCAPCDISYQQSLLPYILSAKEPSAQESGGRAWSEGSQIHFWHTELSQRMSYMQVPKAAGFGLPQETDGETPRPVARPRRSL